LIEARDHSHMAITARGETAKMVVLLVAMVVIALRRGVSGSPPQ
jgi:hypothetical protein